jgi:hypothetical protein
MIFLFSNNRTRGGTVSKPPIKAQDCNLAFWAAVRQHPLFDADPSFGLAKRMGLDTAPLMTAHKQRVDLCARLMGTDTREVDRQITDAARAYIVAHDSAVNEWKALLSRHQGMMETAGKEALGTEWLHAFCLNSGLDETQALTLLAQVSA